MARREPPPNPADCYSWDARAHRSDPRTAFLSNAAEGLYRRFYDYAWLEDGLPRNVKELFPLSRCGTMPQFQALWSTIAVFFPRAADGRLRHLDQEKKRQRVKDRSETRTAAARARWDKKPSTPPPSNRNAHASTPDASALHLQQPPPSNRNAHASTPNASALHMDSSVLAFDLGLDLELPVQTQDQEQRSAISTAVENRQSAHDGKHRPTLDTVKKIAYELIGKRKMSSAVWSEVCEHLKQRCADLKLDYEGLPQAALRSIWDAQLRKERLEQTRQRRRVG